MSVSDGPPPSSASSSSASAPKKPEPPTTAAIVELPAVAECLEEVEHTVAEGETIETIAHKYGIYHLDVLLRHNADLFPSKKFQVALGKAQAAPEHEEVDYGHPVTLEVGKKLKIPPRTVWMKRETGKQHVFRLRSFQAPPAVPRETARRMAMELTLRAYLSIEKAHAKSLKSNIAHKISGKLRYQKMRMGASVGVTGVQWGVTLAVGMLTGATLANPLTLPVIIGIAAGGYTIKKLVTAIMEHGKRKELEQYWKDEDLYKVVEKGPDGTDRTVLARPSIDHLRFHEKGKGLFWREPLTADEQDARRAEHQGDELAENAELTLRRAVVHMRKAWEFVHEDLQDETLGHLYGKSQLERVLKNHEGKTKADAVGFGSCAEMVEEVKHAMRFMHEVDKFKNYLLPSLSFLIFFIDAYTEALDNFTQYRKSLEDPILEFMRSEDHAFCSTGGEDVWKDARFKCMRRSMTGAERDKIWKAYISPITGLATSSADERDRAAKDTGLVGLCIKTTRERLAGIARDIQRSIQENKAWCDRYSVESPAPRYELFKRDLLERYDHPSRWEKLKHKVENYDMRRSKAEKGSDFLTDMFEVAGTLLAGPYIGDAFNAPLSATGSMWAEYGLSMGKSASKAAATTGAGLVVITYNKTTGAGKGRGYERKSELLPLNKERWEHASDQACDDATGKKAKEGAINVDVLFKSIARHYVNANDQFKAFVEKYAGDGDEAVQLTSCRECYVYAKDLYSIHHEIDKMERHLLALLSFTGELVYQAYKLNLHEKEVRDFFELHVKEWVQPSDEKRPGDVEAAPSASASSSSTPAKKDKHANCPKDKVCYGPRSAASLAQWRLPRKRLDGARQLERSVSIALDAEKVHAGVPVKVKVKTDRAIGRIMKDPAKGYLTHDEASEERLADVEVRDETTVKVTFTKHGPGQALVFVPEEQCFADPQGSKLMVDVLPCEVKVSLAPAGPYLQGDKVTALVVVEPKIPDLKAKVKVSCAHLEPPEQTVELHHDQEVTFTAKDTGTNRLTLGVDAMCKLAAVSGERDVHVDRRLARIESITPAQPAVGDTVKVRVKVQPPYGILDPKAKVTIADDCNGAMIEKKVVLELHSDAEAEVKIKAAVAGNLVLESPTRVQTGTDGASIECRPVERRSKIGQVKATLGTGDVLEVPVTIEPPLGMMQAKARVKVACSEQGLFELPAEPTQLHASSTIKLKALKAGRGTITLEKVEGGLCSPFGDSKVVEVTGRIAQIASVGGGPFHAGGKAKVNIRLQPALGAFDPKAKVKLQGVPKKLFKDEKVYEVQLHESIDVAVELGAPVAAGKVELVKVDGGLCDVNAAQVDLPVQGRVASITKVEPEDAAHSAGDKVTVHVKIEPPFGTFEQKATVTIKGDDGLIDDTTLSMHASNTAEVELKKAVDAGKLYLAAAEGAPVFADAGKADLGPVGKRVAKFGTVKPDGPYYAGQKLKAQVLLEPRLPRALSGQGKVKVTGTNGILAAPITVSLNADTEVELELKNPTSAEPAQIKLETVEGGRCEASGTLSVPLKQRTVRIAALDDGPYTVGRKVKVKVLCEQVQGVTFSEKAQVKLKGAALKQEVTGALASDLTLEVVLAAEPGADKLIELEAVRLCAVSDVPEDKQRSLELIAHTAKMGPLTPAKDSYAVGEKVSIPITVAPRLGGVTDPKAKLKLTAAFLDAPVLVALHESTTVELTFTKPGRGNLTLEKADGCPEACVISAVEAEKQRALVVTNRIVEATIEGDLVVGKRARVRLTLTPSLGITADKARVKVSSPGFKDPAGYTAELRADTTVDVTLGTAGSHTITLEGLRGCEPSARVCSFQVRGA